jgi:YidC/Oxa1 family membrane protein insertase
VAVHHVSAHVAAGQTTYCTNPHYAPWYHGGAGFLFIPDLTNTAHGLVLVVLIVLYVGTQLASSLMMATPTMDKTQRQIMLLLPLFFVIFIISFPAGLILYWITTNAWTMGQQYVIKKRLGPVVPPVPAAAAAGGGSGDGAAGDAGTGGLGALMRGLRRPAEDRVKPADVKATRATGGDASGTEAKRADAKEPAGVGARAGTRARRDAPPPPPPRKKKKRSGRRR